MPSLTTTEPPDPIEIARTIEEVYATLGPTVDVIEQNPRATIRPLLRSPTPPHNA
jgi:hypothetical protein